MKSQIGSNTQSAEQLQNDWEVNPRWAGVKRDYTAEDVVRLADLPDGVREGRAGRRRRRPRAAAR